MLPDRAAGSDRAGIFAGGGECGRLMAGVDWAATPLGPVEAWPSSLCNALRTVLASRFPMVLTWGPEYRQFYNDAYAPLIGAKHPAIGEDIRITLAEGWTVLGPPVEHAMAAREASWLPELPLLLERAGYREETYFTVSHAPAFDDDGAVGGMHAVCSEVTDRVVGARRQHLLHELSITAGVLGDERELARGMCERLDADPLDVPFAAVYLTGDTGLERVAVVGCDPSLLPAAVGGPHDLAALAADVGSLGLRGGLWADPVTRALALPLGTAPGAPIGVLLAGASPNRALDEPYRSFFELLAGQFTGALGTARAYEAERRRAQSLAELDRAKTTFFSDVSHELRTPLTLLLGPVRDVLEDAESPVTSEVRDQLAMALRNGERLQRLVNDLLDVASIEAGRTHPVRVATDVAAFTGELAGIFRAAAERAGLRLSVDCAPLDRPVFLDPRMWEKVVVNLLSNAVKYTFVGDIEVGLRADGDGFALTVADTGVGIPAEELPQLFERFHRGTGSVARTREGTGIGLALAHELVGLHGGDITVDSRPGTGSVFTVTMPAGVPDEVASPGSPQPAPGPSAAARNEAANWERASARPGGPAVPSSAEVLVVDDNADMRAYLARLLSPPWNVRTTGDGEEALAAVAERLPDVVLTDVMMPRLDGFGLLRALRADPRTRRVPVIMLTARAGQEASVEGFGAGADDYLAKPFQSAELLARVRVALERSAGRSRSPAASAGTAHPAAHTTPPATAAGPQPTGSGRAAVPSGAVPPRAVPAADDPSTGGSDTAPPTPVADRGDASWRLPATPASVRVLRRGLGTALEAAGADPDHTYDLVLAACEAVTNAIEHAQCPTQPVVDVRLAVVGTTVEIAVRDHGQWRERTASMDRGRGSTLMSAVGEVTATPSPEGTTVRIRCPLFPDRSSAAS